MPKYKLSREERAAKAARKEKIRELMSEMQVKDMEDINSLFKEMVGDILENGLEAELEEIYAVVFMDAIHYNVRCEGRIVKKAVYVAIEINLDGRKEVLGIYVGENEAALYELDNFAEKWDSKYPKISLSWRNHRAELSTYFKYPQSVRTLIYTTNSIENFNRQLRKVTKSKSVFPNDDSLMKMLYLAQADITRKWTGRRKDWGEIRSQLDIYFAERIPE